MDRLERSRMAGTISVFADLERDPRRKAQLIGLMTALQSNSPLNKGERALLDEVNGLTLTCV